MTDKKTEALKLALEALKTERWPVNPHLTMVKTDAAITAIREALAEQPAHESAYQRGYMDGIAKGLRMEQPAQQQCMEHGECFGGECIYPAQQPAQQCWKCGDMDAEFQAKCTVPACGMKEKS